MIPKFPKDDDRDINPEIDRIIQDRIDRDEREFMFEEYFWRREIEEDDPDDLKYVL